jgi:hypothetical protein
MQTIDPTESILVENGRKLFENHYKEIATIKLQELFKVDREISIDILTNSVKTLNLLNGDPDSIYEIPRLGAIGEVLIKIALESKGIEAIPSGLTEDVSEKFDFTILGRKIDISTSPSDETFVQKVTDGKPLTLFVPNYLFKYKDPLQRPKDFPVEISYGYKLLYDNEFDINAFLNETLEMNYFALGLLDDYYQNGLDNWYKLGEDQFGEVTPELILEYQDFLDDLCTELDLPLDTN